MVEAEHPIPGNNRPILFFIGQNRSFLFKENVSDMNEPETFPFKINHHLPESSKEDNNNLL